MRNVISAVYKVQRKVQSAHTLKKNFTGRFDVSNIIIKSKKG